MGSDEGSVAVRGDARPRGLAWDWSAAALGAISALPAAVVVLGDRSRGLALAVGVLPAAIVGILPTRRARLALVVVGVCTGVPMFIGGLLAGVPVLAVAAIAALGVGSALLAARFRLGRIAMTLSLPMVGVGLSYSDLGEADGADARLRNPPRRCRRHRRGNRLPARSRARRLGMRRRTARDASRRGDAATQKRGENPRRRDRSARGKRPRARQPTGGGIQPGCQSQRSRGLPARTAAAGT